MFDSFDFPDWGPCVSCIADASGPRPQRLLMVAMHYLEECQRTQCESVSHMLVLDEAAAARVSYYTPIPQMPSCVHAACNRCLRYNLRSTLAAGKDAQQLEITTPAACRVRCLHIDGILTSMNSGCA